MRLLIIGGVPVSVEASDKISQSYEPIGGVATLRTIAGGAIRQRNWRKLRTTISVPGARFLPSLQALDQDAPQVIKCLAPRSVSSTSNAITLPAARRADAAPWGFALQPSGFAVATPGSLAGNVLTLTPVAGATRYMAMYVPELTVLITSLTEHFDVRGAAASWELTAEEI